MVKSHHSNALVTTAIVDYLTRLHYSVTFLAPKLNPGFLRFGEDWTICDCLRIENLVYLINQVVEGLQVKL